MLIYNYLYNCIIYDFNFYKTQFNTYIICYQITIYDNDFQFKKCTVIPTRNKIFILGYIPDLKRHNISYIIISLFFLIFWKRATSNSLMSSNSPS